MDVNVGTKITFKKLVQMKEEYLKLKKIHICVYVHVWVYLLKIASAQNRFQLGLVYLRMKNHEIKYPPFLTNLQLKKISTLKQWGKNSS